MVIVLMVFVLVTIIVVSLAACLCLVHRCADTVDVGASHRLGDVRQGTPDQGPTGNGDAATNWIARENVSLEQRRQRRSRQGHSASTAQNTLQACAPLAMTTWNPLPVRAPSTLKIQIPFGFVAPSSVNVVSVNVTAAAKQ